MDTSHDDKELRCRRLGNPVPFKYCRCENGEDEPCRLLRHCWFEQFDVMDWIVNNLPKEKAEKLTRDAPPPSKVKSIFEIMREAQERVTKTGDADTP